MGCWHRTMTRWAAMACAITAIAACAAPPQAYPVASGRNAIDGSASVTLQGAPTVTCAGAYVGLYRATPAVRQRLQALYGPGESGYLRIADYRKAGDGPDFATALRQTRCDSQGRFQFGGLDDGDYAVMTNVVWRHKYVTYGGGLMQILRLQGGVVRQVTLSNRTAGRH